MVDLVKFVIGRQRKRLESPREERRSVRHDRGDEGFPLAFRPSLSHRNVDFQWHVKCHHIGHAVPYQGL